MSERVLLVRAHKVHGDRWMTARVVQRRRQEEHAVMATTEEFQTRDQIVETTHG